MSRPDLPELPPDVRALLEHAKGLDAVPTDVASRLLRSVEARVLSSTSPPAPAPLPVRPPAAVGPWLGYGASPRVALATTLLFGVTVGVLLRGAFPTEQAEQVERVTYVNRPVLVASATAALPTPSPIPEAAPETVANAVPTVAVDVRPPGSNAGASMGTAASLAAESRLLDGARTALARGEADHALAATARHEANFPRGALTEEREAMAIKALAMAGRLVDARRRAALFHKSYPESLFGQAIDGTVQDR